MTRHDVMFRLSGPDGLATIAVDAGCAAWIGRDPQSAVTLIANNVSRRHACVEWTPDGLLVTDTSSNGTLVDELLLRRAARLVPGCRAMLQIGRFRIDVEGPELIPVRTVAGASQAPEPEVPEEHVLTVAQATPTTQAGPDLRRRIHRRLLENLDLPGLDRAAMDAAVMRPKVVAALRRIVADLGQETPHGTIQEQLIHELSDEALGLGPLEALLADPDVSEIMVVDPHTIFIERAGKMELSGLKFTDDDSVRAVIERIVTPLGRRIDESTPLVDARLRDGSRVNAVIPPLALRGPCITIRKFAKEPLRMPDLVRFGSLSKDMARFLENAVLVRKNIIISGGTGSGKTTLLNVLSGAIPTHERVVTIEDAAELQLRQPHVVSLEARPPNLEGKGEYTIRDLVKNALRMRPDRIVVGECRGGEAIDMLQAMNTGHEGSLTTTHANSPKEAVARIETLCLMAGLDLPVRAIRQQIASSVHVIVQQSRFSDGSRRVTNVAEVLGIDDDGEVELREIYGFKVTKAHGGSRIEGEFVASGYIPSFLPQFMAHGLVDRRSCGVTALTWWLGRATAVGITGALLTVFWTLFGDVNSLGRQQLRAYSSWLDGKLRFLRSTMSARAVVGTQLAATGAAVVTAISLHQWPSLCLLPVIALAPRVLLERQVARRVARVEEQIEPWVNAVANALKASPSLGEAIASTTTLVPAPMSEEIDVLVKEYELGTPLDRALDALAERIGSQTLSGTVLALKVARKSGGNLPEMLENAAGALRELARLEGVVRTKTAEGKAQAFVIGVIPIPMVGGVHLMDPGFFEPLASTFLGNLIVAGAAAMWAVAILLARKILAVDV